MRMIFADNALSTLAGPVLAGAESFALSITTNFPEFAEGDYTFFRFGNTAAAPDIKVLGRDGNVFACEPLPADFPAGTMVGLVPCRRMFEVFAQSVLMGLGIGTVETLTAGSPATATITGAAPNQALNLGIPRGANGTNGTNGVDGQDAPLLVLDVGEVLTCDYGTPAAASLVGDAYPNLVLNLRLPAGPPGASSITLAMGTVETLAAGAEATATITGTAPSYVLNLGIPAGFDGADGADGTNGTNGSPGPANSLSIGTVQTLSAGASATATITGTAPNQTLNLGIPQGVAGSAVAPARANATLTTASLANNATETGTVALGKSFALIKASADRACRVRLYGTAAQRTADASRAAGTDPTGEHGVVCDLVFTSGNLALDLAPMVFGACQESTVSADIPYSVTNTSGATSAVQVTFSRLAMEA